MTQRQSLENKENPKEKKQAERSILLGNDPDFEIPDGYECPITYAPMDKSVILADGHSYNQPAIEEWFARGNKTSPITSQELAHTRLTPNYTLQKSIQHFFNMQADAQTLQKKSVIPETKQALELKNILDSVQPKQRKIVLVLRKKQHTVDPVIERLSQYKKLLAAVQCSDLEKMTLLLKGGTNSHSPFESTFLSILLFTALYQPNVAVFKRLLEAKPILHIKDKDGYTIPQSLGLFCSWPLVEKKAVLELLAKKNVSLPLLHQAACLGEEKILEQSIAQQEIPAFAVQDHKKNTTLHYATANGQIKILEKLNKKYPNQLSLKNENGLTPLLLAAATGQLKALQWLLNHGASLTEQCDNDCTALLWAAYCGELGVMQWLLKNGAALTERSKCGCTALLLTALNGHLDTVQWLLTHGASLMERSRDYSTALLFAACNGHLPTVKWLLAHGASLTEKNRHNTTALLSAAHNGQLELVQWLLAHGASLAEKDHYGYTALLLAARAGHLETVQWLLEHGASLAEKEHRGYTALLLAARAGQLETVRWLLEHGASLTETDKRGNTALLLAVAADQLEATQWLITAGGASLSEANHKRQTAFDLGKTTPMQKLLCQILSSPRTQATQKKQVASLPHISSTSGRVFPPVRSASSNSSSSSSSSSSVNPSSTPAMRTIPW